MSDKAVPLSVILLYPDVFHVDTSAEYAVRSPEAKDEFHPLNALKSSVATPVERSGAVLFTTIISAVPYAAPAATPHVSYTHLTLPTTPYV